MTDMPKTRWATTADGASIAYQVLGGSDQTLVVIHPWASHLEVYWEQPRFARFMRRLARDLRVVHMDKRGWGMSDRIFGTPDVSLLMDDVKAVMDASGTDRAAVLGLGGTGGAPLAALFAATYPERTAALLLDGNLFERWTPEHPQGVTDEAEEEWDDAFAAIWGDDDHAVECAQCCYGDRAEDCPLDDRTFLLWWTKTLRYSCTPTSMVAFSKMWHVTDIRPVLPTIHVPTAVLCKTRAPEPGQSEENQRDWAAFNVRHIPGAQLIEVPGAAHVIWIEDPQPYVSAVERFLRSVRDEQAELDRMLATVPFTDIVGSTDKACELGDTAWTELLGRHNRVLRALLARYRGQEVGSIAAHIGARVGALAGPSEVLVSSTVKDLVAGSCLAFDDRDEHELKCVPGPWHL
ncbi:MAG: alpha/beta fold hydrolase, partial [Thermoleophilia bacterium]|nr:alpha/beta fold hydrolase [Thermoleophilia bacterium]